MPLDKVFIPTTATLFPSYPTAPRATKDTENISPTPTRTDAVIFMAYFPFAL